MPDFDFSKLPAWYSPYVAGYPFMHRDLGIYIFWLNASVDIYDFVCTLPQVSDTYPVEAGGALWVALAPSGIQQYNDVERTYNAILRSIDEHLNPPELDIDFVPLANAWELALDAAIQGMSS